MAVWFPIVGFPKCCCHARELNHSVAEVFDSFNLGCQPAVGFAAPCACPDPESLAAMRDSVVMEMVDKGEAHAAF